MNTTTTRRPVSTTFVNPSTDSNISSSITTTINAPTRPPPPPRTSFNTDTKFGNQVADQPPTQSVRANTDLPVLEQPAASSGCGPGCIAGMSAGGIVLVAVAAIIGIVAYKRRTTQKRRKDEEIGRHEDYLTGKMTAANAPPGLYDVRGSGVVTEDEKEAERKRTMEKLLGKKEDKPKEGTWLEVLGGEQI